MAVYERAYEAHAGPLTPRRTRFLILPRYALRETFASRAFVAFYVVCFAWPVVLMLLTYFSHNLRFLQMLTEMGGSLEPGSLLEYDGAFFMTWYMGPQFWMSLILTFIVAPALVAPDLSNNGLPLYLSRPFTRTDYVLGKATVLVVLLSSITWIPGLLLYLLKSNLAGWGWFASHLRLAGGLVVASAVMIAILTVVGLALSAYVRWKPLARLALFGLFLLGAGLGNAINGVLDTRWGSVLDLFQVMLVTWAGLFGVEVALKLPVWGAWVALAAIVASFVGLLYRKIEAYEVVR